jgi:hypothetical protein
MACQRDLTLLAAGFAVALGMVATYHLGRAHADGLPATDTMYFGGTLDENGVLVTGTRDVTVRFYDAESGGTPVCETAAPAAPLQAGRFRIALNARCTTAVRDNANVWSQLTVGTTTIAGRSRLGAVPYAVEAQRASGLTPRGPGAGCTDPDVLYFGCLYARERGGRVGSDQPTESVLHGDGGRNRGDLLTAQRLRRDGKHARLIAVDPEGARARANLDDLIASPGDCSYADGDRVRRLPVVTFTLRRAREIHVVHL